MPTMVMVNQPPVRATAAEEEAPPILPARNATSGNETVVLKATASASASESASTSASAVHPNGASSILAESYGWDEFHPVPNPLIVFLREGRKTKSERWLRIQENEYDKFNKGKKKGQMKSHLSARENQRLADIKMELNRVVLCYKRVWPAPFTPISDLAYAFGVSKSKVINHLARNANNNGATTRRVRSDAGRTIFNSSELRDKFYTPYNHFKKWQHKRHPGENLTEKELKEAYNQLRPSVLHECRLGAEAEKQIVVNIDSEIKAALQKTNGSIGWKRLASHIAGGDDKDDAWDARDFIRK